MSKYSIKSVLCALLLAFPISGMQPAVSNDVVLGLGTSFSAYSVAKLAQQLYKAFPVFEHQLRKAVPFFQKHITCDHAGAAVLVAVLCKLGIIYYKKILADKCDVEKIDSIVRYLRGMVGGLVLVGGIEIYINWNPDWRTTLFPVFGPSFDWLFSSDKK